MANTNRKLVKVDNSAESQFLTRIINKYNASQITDPTLARIYAPTGAGAEILGVSSSFLKKAKPKLTKNGHYIDVSPTQTVWHLQFMQDWLICRGDPQALERHEQAVDKFISALPSNQPQKSGRKSKTPASVA